MRVAGRPDRLPLSGFHYRLLLLSGLGWLFDPRDGGLMSFVLARLKVEWHLGPDQIVVAGSAGLAGMFLGGAVAGSLADRFGRKTVFQTTLLIFSVSTGLGALVQRFASLVLLRFLVGSGLGGELPVAAACGRIGGILAPLAVGELMGERGGGFTTVFVMFAAVLATGSVSVAGLGEETRGRTLEEISG